MVRRFLLSSICCFSFILPVKTLFGQSDTLQYQAPTQDPFKIKTFVTSLMWVKDSTGIGRQQKDTLDITRMFSGAIILPGYGQAYNRQYWKLPIVYGAIGSSLYFGYKNNLKYLETDNDRYAKNRDLLYTGAFLAYWGTLLDGVINYKSTMDFLPGRALLYSALIPGLGQAYNGDYWKIPIYCGGLMFCGYLIQFNNMQYQRYRNDYNNPNYTGRLTPDNLKWYRDVSRRYRDYSILAAVAVYALTIIDANIFAYFNDFDVSDDLSFKIQPGFIEPVNARFASNTHSLPVGLTMKISF